MNILKKKSSYEIGNLHKKNATLRERYLKLQEDQNANLVSAVATHRTYQVKTDEADMTCRERTP